MHVRQPYVQLVPAAQAQYQAVQPQYQAAQPQYQLYQQPQPAPQPAHEQLLQMMMMQQQPPPPPQPQPQPQPQSMQQPCLPVGGDAQLLGQLMATPLWAGQAAAQPSVAPVMKVMDEKVMDANEIATRVLEKVRERVGDQVDAAKQQLYAKDSPGTQDGGIVELKAKSAALSSHVQAASPASVRSLATSIVDSVSDVLLEAARKRQDAERRAARAEEIAEDTQRRLALQAQGPVPSAAATQLQPRVQPQPEPEPQQRQRRHTPPQRDAGLQPAASSTPSSAEWSAARPRHDGTPQRPPRQQSPDVTPERREPDRSLRLSAASKQTRAHHEDARVALSDVTQRDSVSGAAIGSRVPRQQRVVDLQSWIVDTPVKTRQQSTQTTGDLDVDDLTPVSRMKKLMEAVAAAEEKARLMGEETARAREECQTAEARSSSMVAQHDELQAMLAADERRVKSQTAQELAALKASRLEEKRRADATAVQLRVAEAKAAELEDMLSRERNAAAAARSVRQEQQEEASVAARVSSLQARGEWEHQRQQLEAALLEAKQQLAEQQRAQSLADGTVSQLTEEIQRASSRAADAASSAAQAQAQHNVAVAEVESESAAREQAQLAAARARGEEAKTKEQLAALQQHIKMLEEQLEGVRHEMQVKDIQSERKRRALVEATEAAAQKALSEQRDAELHVAEIQRLSNELEEEREARAAVSQPVLLLDIVATTI
jgi:hypothetical protein